MIRILIADDHEVIRRGLRDMLEQHADWQVCGEAVNGRQAVELALKTVPHVALLDLMMPEMNGLEATRAIKKELPKTEVLVFTVHETDELIRDVLSAGARGYLLKSQLRKGLLEAIRAVHAGQKCIPPEIAAQLANHATDETLSAREVEVLRLVAAGNANKQIATLLSITEETVKGHLKNILAKLGANDRTHAVTIGLKRGIIDL